MSEITRLNKGEFVVVMCGYTSPVKEYVNHPQVIFIDAVKRIMNLSELIHVNTKLFILTEGVEELNYQWVMAWCRTRKCTYLIRKSNQAIYDVLKYAIPNGGEEEKVSIEEVKETQVHGKLNALIPHINWSESNAQNAKRLLREAIKLNIKTTEGSLAQWMANQRKKQNGTVLPKSARSKLDVSVEMLDDAIKGLTDIRDFLIATVEENRLIKQKYEKVKKVMDE